MNNRLFVFALLVFFVFVGFGYQGSAQEIASGVEAVHIIPISGSIEPGLARFVQRVLKDAEKANSAVLFEINTFGGRVDSATEIRDLILSLNVPVISFVTERAWSAGALITLAAPHVAMAPGSSIGAAEPRPLEEKTVSALRAEFESTAARANRDPKIAAAMVDADVAIEGLVEKGKILSLTAGQARERGFADVIASSREEVLNHYGLTGLPVIEHSPNWAEQVARFITEPTVSSLLLTIGFLGLIFEVTSPGWGVPGTAGIVALSLFFGGSLVTGLAGLEVVILFITGIILLLVEIFILPGFGAAGVLGISAVLTAIVMAFGSVQTAMFSLFVALLATVVFLVLFWKRFSRSGAWSRLVLAHREAKEQGYKGPRTYKDLVGKEGVTITPLRPSGTALIEGERFDVVSEGTFLLSDTPIRVVFIEGSRVVVRDISEEK